MADQAQQEVVARMIQATAREVGAAMSTIVSVHGIGASTPITVRDSEGQEINTTIAQLIQMQFEATVDLTEALDDLIEAMAPPSRARKTPPKRKKRGG